MVKNYCIKSKKMQRDFLGTKSFHSAALMESRKVARNESFIKSISAANKGISLTKPEKLYFEMHGMYLALEWGIFG